MHMQKTWCQRNYSNLQRNLSYEVNYKEKMMHECFLEPKIEAMNYSWSQKLIILFTIRRKNLLD